jgi:hypothetical protein
MHIMPTMPHIYRISAQVLDTFRTAMAKAIPTDGITSIAAWEQKVKPLSAATGGTVGTGGAMARSASEAASSGVQPALIQTSAEETATAHAERTATIRAEWAGLSVEAKALHKNSFRAYRKQTLSTMLLVFQRDGAGS